MKATLDPDGNWHFNRTKIRSEYRATNGAFSLCIFFAAVAFLAGCGFIVYQTVRLASWERTYSTIVAIHAGTVKPTTKRQGQVHSQTSKTVYDPEYEFMTRDGTSIRFRGTVSYSSPPSIGTRVPVLYSPDNPNAAVVDTFAEKWMPAMVAFIFMVVACVGAVMVHVKGYGHEKTVSIGGKRWKWSRLSKEN